MISTKPNSIGILMMILITSSTTSISNNRCLYPYIFKNENTLFITIVHQIAAQISLAENNFPTNPNWLSSMQILL